MATILPLNLSKEDQQKVVLIGLLALIIFVVGYYLLLAPGCDRLGKAGRALAECKVKVVDGREMIQDKDRIGRLAREADEKLKKLHEWIPEETETSWILKLISDIASTQKIRTVAIKPVKEEGLEETGFFKLATCQVELKTDYHSLGKFVDQLERKNPYLQIKDINIESSADGSTRHDVNFKILYFVVTKKN